MRTFAGISELEKAVGTHLGYSDRHHPTQGQIDRFAAATGDHQWIHSAVPVRSRLRAGVELRELTTGTSGTRCRTRITIERAGSDKPACVAETLSLLVP
ncbi:hypothetical protein ACNJ7E_31195 [Rhodococcus sp. NM-2]|uniref:hypothetical protein n=1 Tax=Rhodococcus TaxID=1827 RepID=UPI0024763127|nr:hypothetical protein [Rhodococcus opacus]MDH6289677.1 acyl dehydratase [Rhodococcus opacus]